MKVFHMLKNKKGFTLVELTVVIVVIGILSAIGAVGYSGWRETTIKNQLKSELTMAAAAMENYRNFNGIYPDSVDDVFTSRAGVIFSGGSQDGNYYGIDATSQDGKLRFSTSDRGEILSGPAPIILLDAAAEQSYGGSGSVWHDLSGNGYNASGLSTIGFSSEVGGSLVFSGNDAGLITNNPTIDFSHEQTLIIAMKQPASTTRRNPWNQSYGGYGTWVQESLADCSNKMRQYFGSSGTNAAPYNWVCGPGVVDNGWVVYGATRDGTSMKWYVNGSLYSTSPNPYGSPLPVVDTNNIEIGHGYCDYWQGSMSLIIAYTKALSADEMKAVFEKYRSRYSL